MGKNRKNTVWSALFTLLTLSLHTKILKCSAVPLFQKIVYPPENEVDASAARIQKNSISGTIWSMSFISQDHSQSKGHNPVLAVVINRYDGRVFLN